MYSFLDFFTQCLGILYVIIWSVSFYFQLILMIKLKNGEGYSIDFQIFNIFGFGFYTISNIHYMFQNGGDFNSIIDLIFSTHAFLISILLIALTLYYPRGKNLTHYGTYIKILVLFIMSIIYYLLNSYLIKGASNDLWIFMGLGKSIVSTVKYLYQIYLNKERCSTKGFSIQNVLLDLAGGSLSLLQVVLEIVFNNNRSFFDDKTNIPKIGLSLVVIFFDFVLIYQHYFVFKCNQKIVDEENEKFIQFKNVKG